MTSHRCTLTSFVMRVALLLLLPVFGGGLNVCTDFETIKTSDWLHMSASPNGGSQAGNYSKTKASSLAECLRECCDLVAKCDTMFYHAEECFLINCNTPDRNACKPKHRTGKKFQHTYLVNVREHADNATSENVNYMKANHTLTDVPVNDSTLAVGPPSTGPTSDRESTTTGPNTREASTPVADTESPTAAMALSSTPQSGSQTSSSSHHHHPSSSYPKGTGPDDLADLNGLLDKLRSDCDTDTGEGCARNEVCNFVVDDMMMGAVCQCRRGFTVDPDSHECVDASPRPQDVSCTFGLVGECAHHEECVPRNGRSRVGLCQCVDEYTQNAETGWCEPDAPSHKAVSGSSRSDVHSSPRPPAITASTASPVMSSSVSVKTASPNVSTQHVQTSTTTGLPKGQRSTSTVTTATTSTPPSTTTVKHRSVPVTAPRVTKKTVDLEKTTIIAVNTTVEPLMVSAGGNKDITLPLNSITLSAYALPTAQDGDYKYEWSLISHPEGDQVGHMDDINTAHLKLSKLIVGLYTFKVAVSTEGKYGEALVNVTVLDAARLNQAPVAVISPKSQSVNEPNDVVFDGSMSTDDDKIVQYHWEQVSGPLNSHKAEEADNERAMLVMKGLSPGKYTFKLTVTDSDGAENSTVANVTLIKEMDYPPKANAGSNVILSLPQNSVTLYGNGSTDDKGIASYEWIKKSNDKLTADMTGTRSQYLVLKNLEIGDYTFSLKVADTSGQTSTADVHVFVKPEHNKPPIARSGTSKIVWLPTASTTLDGSNSTDDTQISTYSWTQISGPSTILINNADRAVATASKLIPGVYKFRLTVVDVEGLQSSDVVTITVKQNENHPPQANAGGDKIVVLPVTLVSLDGTGSSDDKGIVSYKWTRDEKSLAAGDILNGTDHTAVLQLINVVAGRYIFSLEVVDAEGLTASDSASIIVREDEKSNDLVELHLEADLGSFSEANKKSLSNQLGLLLHRTNQEGTTRVVISRLSDMRASGELSVTFYAVTVMKDQNLIQQGTEVVSLLKKKLRTDADVIDFRITLLDTLLCQNNCSSHGHCDSHTKRCVCEAFWMENPVLVYLYGESNCDWSVLYVIIIAFVILVGLAGVIWGIVCLCRRCYKWRPKKRHRYTLLDELEDSNEGTEMIPRGRKRPNNGLTRKIQNSSLMISESDFSSDEETLFINHKKANGHVKNGLKPKNKVKT